MLQQVNRLLAGRGRQRGGGPVGGEQQHQGRSQLLGGPAGPLGLEGVPIAIPDGKTPLQLLRRLDAPPPTVVVRPPQATRREASRGLVDALLDGAFSVVDRPCHPETMLRIMQRIMDRHFTHSHSPHPSQEKQS